nr:MAG TPA: hypothetical protein [Crassvirales sp.]
MDNIEFAKQNLGKNVIVDLGYRDATAMIVGHDNEDIIVGFTENNFKGWTNIDNKDILLVYSPIIKTYWYVKQEDISIIE